MPNISNMSKGLCIAYLGAANTFMGKNADAVIQYDKAIEFAKQNKVGKGSFKIRRFPF